MFDSTTFNQKVQNVQLPETLSSSVCQKTYKMRKQVSRKRWQGECDGERTKFYIYGEPRCSPPRFGWRSTWGSLRPMSWTRYQLLEMSMWLESLQDPSGSAFPATQVGCLLGTSTSAPRKTRAVESARTSSSRSTQDGALISCIARWCRKRMQANSDTARRRSGKEAASRLCWYLDTTTFASLDSPSRRSQNICSIELKIRHETELKLIILLPHPVAGWMLLACNSWKLLLWIVYGFWRWCRQSAVCYWSRYPREPCSARYCRSP